MRCSHFAPLLGLLVSTTFGCAAAGDATPGSSRSSGDGSGHGSSGEGAGGSSSSATGTGGAPSSSSSSSSGTGGATDCSSDLDKAGCNCDVAGETRACYTGPAGTQHLGTCADGAQTCVASGEFAQWGPCTGDVLPGLEDCANARDTNCNGATGCNDAVCTSVAGCCSPGDTRPCYDGPPGTSGVGICKPGQQACGPTGAWGTCMGETLPGHENGHCGDGLDNDCNGKTDCEQFACQLDAACHMVCSAGETRACYSGPSGTQGVGPCAAGTQTCNSDGTGYGACVGEVVPTPEGAHCGDGIDNDCNGHVDCADVGCASAAACCTPDPTPADGTIWANSPTTLYRVDPNTFATTTVGNFNISEEMTDVAVTPDGKLYGISFTSLYHVNMSTGAGTFIADVSGNGNNSLTFLPNGNLLAADGGGNLKTINPASGQVTSVGSYGNGLASAGDLIAVKSGALYGTSSTKAGGGDASGNNQLLRIDPATGVATAVGPTGYAEVWGLAYSNAHVIGFTTSGAIIRIDPQTGAGSSVGQQSVTFWGAGQSPLVVDNSCN